MEWITLGLTAAAFFFLELSHRNKTADLEMKLQIIEHRVLEAFNDQDDMNRGYNTILQKNDSRISALERKR